MVTTTSHNPEMCMLFFKRSQETCPSHVVKPSLNRFLVCFLNTHVLNIDSMANFLAHTVCTCIRIPKACNLQLIRNSHLQITDTITDLLLQISNRELGRVKGVKYMNAVVPKPSPVPRPSPSYICVQCTYNMGEKKNFTHYLCHR